MDAKLLQLKGDFNNIITIRTTVKNIFDILQVRIDKLKDLYAEFIKTSKTQMFIFGLDSFHFQSKLIDIEYDDMKRLFLAINNRMYCEYFKLYKIIIEYILKSNHDKKITELVKVNNYPIYKDLEPFKEYKFEIILDIHENILNLLSILLYTITNKENELVLHKGKQQIGLNIDNFITTFNYNINSIKEKLTLFVTYIEFFHKLHTTYLKRFANKIQLMYTHVNNDIQFDETLNIGRQNEEKSDIQELINLGSRNSPTNSKRSIDSRESTSSKSSTSSRNSKNNTSFILDYNNPSNIQFSEDLSNINRSRTNSHVSSNNSSNISSVTPRFTLKKLKQPLGVINSKEETKKIETTISHDELNNMFSSIDMTCDFLIKKNNEKTPSPTPIEPNIKPNIENNVFEYYEDHMEDDNEEKQIEPFFDNLVHPEISQYSVINKEFLDPHNDDTSEFENIIKNDNDFFVLGEPHEENNTSDFISIVNIENTNNIENIENIESTESTNTNNIFIEVTNKKRKKNKKKK